MDRRGLLGIACGTIALVFIISGIFCSGSFDHRLIDQVEDGVPADELIPQIDNETLYLQAVAKVRLEEEVMDKKYWGNGDLAMPDDYGPYITSYKFELKIIEQYADARKEYARREITKTEFLTKIEGPQDYYKLYNNFN